MRKSIIQKSEQELTMLQQICGIDIHPYQQLLIFHVNLTLKINNSIIKRKITDVKV